MASLFAGKIIRPIADAMRAVDAAFVTGIGVQDALRALKTLNGVDAAAVAAIEKEVQIYEELRTACSANSFPGTTEVVLADGSHKALRDVRTGDLLMAADPKTGRTQSEPVTRTFHHSATDLVDVTLTDGGHLTSTPGHRIFVTGSGWTLASGLHPGNALRTPDGERIVAALADRRETRPMRVYDLTVSGLHIFYAVAGDSPVLVHNCNDLVFEGQKFSGQAHTLDEHTAGIVTPPRRPWTWPSPRLLPTREGSLPTVCSSTSRPPSRSLTTRWPATPTESRPGSARPGHRAWTGRATSVRETPWARPDGRVTTAGNQYYIKFVRASGHKAGFYIQTCYPK